MRLIWEHLGLARRRSRIRPACPAVSRAHAGEMRAAAAELDHPSRVAMENRARRVRRCDSSRIFSAIIRKLAPGAWRSRPAIIRPSRPGSRNGSRGLWNEKRARESLARGVTEAESRSRNLHPGPSARESSRPFQIAAGCPVCWNRSFRRQARARAGQSHLAWLCDWNLHGSGRARSVAPRPARASDHSRRPHLFQKSGGSAIRLGNRSARASRLDPPAGRRISAPHRSGRCDGEAFRAICQRHRGVLG